MTKTILNPHNPYNRIINHYSRGLRDITSHGVDHSLRLIQDIIGMAYKNWKWENALTQKELFVLYASSWFHDIGMIINREKHSEHSREILERVLASEFEGLFLIGKEEQELITHVIWAHSSKVNINSVPNNKYNVRLKGIAALFRIFDACDITESRAPRRIYEIIKDDMDKKSREFWEAHQQISTLEFESPNIIKIIKKRNANEDLLMKAIKELEKEIETTKDILSNEGLPVPEIKII